MTLENPYCTLLTRTFTPTTLTEAQMRYFPQWLKVLVTILVGNAMVTAMRYRLYDGTNFDMITRVATCVLLFYVAWRTSFLTDLQRTYFVSAVTGTLTSLLGAITLGMVFNKIEPGGIYLMVSLTMFIMISITNLLRQRDIKHRTMKPMRQKHSTK